MKRHSFLFAASALALAGVLASCSSTAPAAEQASAGPAPTTTAAAGSPDVAAGNQVYDRFCSVCHNGGDETAPVLATLNTLGRDRISTALAKDGLMAVQAGMLNEEQRTHVIAFLSASAEVRRQVAGADLSTDPTGRNRAAYIEGIPYPARRIRAERDSAEGPRAPAWPAPKLGEGPFELESWEQRNLHVSVVARGLTSPRAIEFLPTGEILVAERAGSLRIVRNGKLDPNPVAGTPKVAVLGTATGFMDIKLHPNFASNGLIYLSYHKPARGEYGNNAIFRGKWNGKEIVDGKDIFVSDDVDALYFQDDVRPGRQALLHHRLPRRRHRRLDRPRPEAGRLRRQDAAPQRRRHAPGDNPFVGKEGLQPEIFTLGHRVNLGLALNPWTKEFWVSETGPRAGTRSTSSRRAELWLAGDQRRPLLFRHEGLSGTLQGGHDAAAYLLCAGHRAGRHGVLHRRQIPRLEAQPLPRLDAHEQLSAHRPPGADRVQRELGSHPQRRCCWSTCTSASATWSRAPMATST